MVMPFFSSVTTNFTRLFKLRPLPINAFPAEFSFKYFVCFMVIEVSSFHGMSSPCFLNQIGKWNEQRDNGTFPGPL